MTDQNTEGHTAQRRRYEPHAGDDPQCQGFIEHMDFPRHLIEHQLMLPDGKPRPCWYGPEKCVQFLLHPNLGLLPEMGRGQPSEREHLFHEIVDIFLKCARETPAALDPRGERLDQPASVIEGVFTGPWTTQNGDLAAPVDWAHGNWAYMCRKLGEVSPNIHNLGMFLHVDTVETRLSHIFIPISEDWRLDWPAISAGLGRNAQARKPRTVH